MSCWTYGAGEPVVSSRLLAEEYNPSVSTWDTTTFYTEGSPYWPFIVPPVEMTEFDPVWKKSCRFWHTAGDPHFALNFGVFDPVRPNSYFLERKSNSLSLASHVDSCCCWSQSANCNG